MTGLMRTVRGHFRVCLRESLSLQSLESVVEMAPGREGNSRFFMAVSSILTITSPQLSYINFLCSPWGQEAFVSSLWRDFHLRVPSPPSWVFRYGCLTARLNLPSLLSDPECASLVFIVSGFSLLSLVSPPQLSPSSTAALKNITKGW